MEHIGIDLGSKESQVCVRNIDSEIVEEKRCRTDQLGRYLGKRPPERVVLETCTEAFKIAGRARRKVDTMSRMSQTRAVHRVRRQFSDEFKARAIRLVLEEGKTVGAVARELDLTPSALAEWVRRALLGTGNPLPEWGTWDRAYSSEIIGVEARRGRPSSISGKHGSAVPRPCSGNDSPRSTDVCRSDCKRARAGFLAAPCSTGASSGARTGCLFVRVPAQRLPPPAPCSRTSQSRRAFGPFQPLNFLQYGTIGYCFVLFTHRFPHCVSEKVQWRCHIHLFISYDLRPSLYMAN